MAYFSRWVVEWRSSCGHFREIDAPLDTREADTHPWVLESGELSISRQLNRLQLQTCETLVAAWLSSRSPSQPRGNNVDTSCGARGTAMVLRDRPTFCPVHLAHEPPGPPIAVLRFVVGALSLGGTLSQTAIKLEATPESGLDAVLKLDDIERRRVFLQSGELHVSTHPTRVVTILGSCVSVCLYDPMVGVGGINHYLLPQALELTPRIGSFAIAQLVNRVLKHGARRSALMAKVFGGANVLTSEMVRKVGSANYELALNMLSQEGIPVVEQDVGGNRGRKLIFDTDVGTAWVKLL